MCLDTKKYFVCRANLESVAEKYVTGKKKSSIINPLSTFGSFGCSSFVIRFIITLEKKHFSVNYFLYHQENLHLSELSGWEEDFDKFLNITIAENDEVSGLHTVEK